MNYNQLFVALTSRSPYFSASLGSVRVRVVDIQAVERTHDTTRILLQSGLSVDVEETPLQVMEQLVAAREELDTYLILQQGRRERARLREFASMLRMGTTMLESCLDACADEAGDRSPECQGGCGCAADLCCCDQGDGTPPPSTTMPPPASSTPTSNHDASA